MTARAGEPLRRVAIVGSTASGKSAVALEAARRLGGVQLVSIDSMQVYRRMDIGTAKPSEAQRAEVTHHCIDLVDPSASFTVAQFTEAYADANRLIDAAEAKAILVGGTGLYHRVVIDDFDLPGEWPDIRADLEATSDVSTLFDRLAARDPVGASRTEPSNRRRVVRALEVCIGSGKPFSSFGPGVNSYPPTPVLQIGIRRPRPVITQLVADRVHEMIERGLVDEVHSIADTVGFSRTAAQALGYKEILRHLGGEIGQDEAIDMIITSTRQFAVRQERWFRRDPRVRWIDVENDPVAEVVPAVIDALTST